MILRTNYGDKGSYTKIYKSRFTIFQDIFTFFLFKRKINKMLNKTQLSYGNLVEHKSHI